MAGDSERRFQRIMDKLYQSSSPKSKTSSLSSDGIGKKRAESGLRVSAGSMGSVGLVPPCRPWDRGDLMRRLATFKAMTWFGKPKSISPVNCARRGWINVETDVIACEACGARILFSTPSSWTLQQVEKAAAVFSLKLDNGHKLLCPWIDNACDEALALFPPTPPPALVDGYRERSTALLQLTALPVVSLSAIDYMRSPQLEHFLSQSPHPSITLSNGIRLTDGFRGKDVECAAEAATASLYYQAQKIISLCGWEPRLLPYVVDCKDQPSKSSGEILGEQKDSTIIYPSSGPSEVEGGNNNQPSLGEHQYDPSCVVLDCQFCGARVGLWAFATVQRPLESFTLITDPNGQNEPATCSADLVSGVEVPRAEIFSKRFQYINKGVCDTGNTGSASKERPLGLNLTIAGGPPPTKQNFRPIVSFPIISRHLRAEFASSSGVRDYVSSKVSCGNLVNAQFCSQNDVPSQQWKDINGGLVVSSEGALSSGSKRKRSENEYFVSRSNDVNGQSDLKGESHVVGNSLRSGEKSGDLSSEGAQEIHSLHEGIGDIVSSKEIMHNRAGDLQNDSNSEGAEENALHSERETGNTGEVGESICTTSYSNVTLRDSEACENNSVDVCYSHDNTFSRADSLNPGGTSEDNHCDPSPIASCSGINATPSNTRGIETGKGDRSSDFQNLEDVKENDQKANGLKNKGVVSANREEDADHASGNNLKAPLCDKRSEFDPIRQHRPFCPWIAPEDGESLPGWKLTLAALVQQEKDSSSGPLQLDSPSTLLDEEDDPIVSIQKLFMSPPTKRLKGTH